MTDAFRFGVGLGFAFVFGDFCVCGEAACVGVGAFAAGVDAEAGGVDMEAAPSDAFFLATAEASVGVAVGRGLGCVGCGVAACGCCTG